MSLAQSWKISRRTKMPEAAPVVTPEPIWQLMTAFQLSAAYKAAVELELFTHVAEGHQTAGELASACGAAERGIRILADTLTVVGLLHKDGTKYSLSDAAAAFLDKRQQS